MDDKEKRVYWGGVCERLECRSLAVAVLARTGALLDRSG
jgi:hypothetical protein